MRTLLSPALKILKYHIEDTKRSSETNCDLLSWNFHFQLLWGQKWMPHKILNKYLNAMLPSSFKVYQPLQNYLWGNTNSQVKKMRHNWRISERMTLNFTTDVFMLTNTVKNTKLEGTKENRHNQTSKKKSWNSILVP